MYARPEKIWVKTVCTVLDHAVFIIATGVNAVAVVVTVVAVAATVGGERARVLYASSLLTH